MVGILVTRGETHRGDPSEVGAYPCQSFPFQPPRHLFHLDHSLLGASAGKGTVVRDVIAVNGSQKAPRPKPYSPQSRFVVPALLHSGG